jgi:hypothetical protein
VARDCAAPVPVQTFANFMSYKRARLAEIFCGKQTLIGGESNMARRGSFFPMHTPSDWTFWLSAFLVLVAVISSFVRIDYVSVHAFWIAVVGYIVLVFGVTFKTA